MLANDEAPVGPLGGAEVVSGPTHGSLELAADGSFVYTPEAGYVGPDSLEYRASDGSYATSAVVAFTVEPASEAPGGGGVFAGCAAGGRSGGWLAIALLALLLVPARWGRMSRRRPGLLP